MTIGICRLFPLKNEHIFLCLFCFSMSNNFGLYSGWCDYYTVCPLENVWYFVLTQSGSVLILSCVLPSVDSGLNLSSVLSAFGVMVWVCFAHE